MRDFGPRFPLQVDSFLNTEPKANAMFRFSLIVCVSLILGVSAKPLNPWNKLKDEALQDTVMSIDEKGKMTWKVEVEPPEDMGETHYDINPNMMIWKSMTGGGQDQQLLKAEEDLDELHHPSMADLLQNMDVLSAANIQPEPLQELANLKYYQEAEEDKDDINHPAFSEVVYEEPEQDWDDVYHKESEEVRRYLAPMVAGYEAGAEANIAHSEPEKDEDDLYHRDEHPAQMEPLRPEVGRGSEVRVHLEPEEDMDDLYHRDPLMLVPYQDDAEAAAPVDLLSQREYSEPEEDLDDLYHK